jgi:hypothetical protein
MLPERPYMAEARLDRRLAAILAADIAGYSRLMRADEVGTLAGLKNRWRALRKRVLSAKKSGCGCRPKFNRQRSVPDFARTQPELIDLSLVSSTAPGHHLS